MNYTEKGSKLYLFSIVLVAVIGACFSATIQQSYPVPIKGFRHFLWVPPILSTQIRFTALPLPVHLSDVSSVVLFRDSSHPIWDVRILFS